MDRAPRQAAWRTGRCRVNDTDLHYWRTGQGQLPVVALHGLMGSGACWMPLARKFAPDHDVVMPDARGHGASGAPPQGYHYRDHALDVVGLTEALHLNAPVLLGHSMGGMTAAVVAARPGAGVRGVVLVDPTFLSPEQQREVYASDVAAQHRQRLRSNKREVLADLQRRHPQRSPEMLGLLAQARWQTRIQACEVLRPPSPDHRELIGRIQAPVLLVIGTQGVVSLDTAQELQALNPRLRCEQIPEAGHGLPYDQPERLAAVVQAFLGSLEDRQPVSG
ncbi:alpha/beta hydrolase [Deinococcus irradiatisoli]|uniref:Alpha/beta hydrolase n=1 Tax=Deinococcus irradiatisoli TaxID=2202254 RepID=A0A2Z3JAF2_9DEIO|nr:alpha/beta hydrolase [Deinococcus irradiatisoli]AWN21972.1 alpha/beta hydrolase [Deinococcus irradiatisoli]